MLNSTAKYSGVLFFTKLILENSILNSLTLVSGWIFKLPETLGLSPYWQDISGLVVMRIFSPFDITKLKT